MVTVAVDRTGTYDGLASCIKAASTAPSARGLLVMGCDANEYARSQLDSLLAAQTLPLFGGTFPGLVVEQERITKGAIVVALPWKPEVQLIEGVGVCHDQLERALDAAPIDPAPGDTVIVFVDALSHGITNLMAGLFDRYGLAVNFIGGGAGSLSLEPLPCVYSNKGVSSDAAVVALLPTCIGLGVLHGWQIASDPVRVTSARGRVLHELDARPAYEVYADLVQAYGVNMPDRGLFAEFAPAYPLGVCRVGNEPLVRDVIDLQPDGALILVSDIQEGAHVQLLYGDFDTLFGAAAGARGSAAAAPCIRGAPPALSLAMDCVSRSLFLGEDFHKELALLGQLDCPLVGALTIGEIANDGREWLAFMNKTVALGLFAAHPPEGADAL